MRLMCESGSPGGIERGGGGAHRAARWVLVLAAGLLLGGCLPEGFWGKAGEQTVNRSAKQDRLPIAARPKGEGRTVLSAAPREGARAEQVLADSAFFPTSFRGTAPPVVARRAPIASAAPVPSPSLPNGRAPLESFFAALRALEAGQRARPVTILHLGDSHIARDNFSGELRALFQARFGDAGRGMMMPAGVFRRYRARGIRFSLEGPWSVSTALEGDKGPYGLSLARARAASASARMGLALTESTFDWAELSFITGPGAGAARIAVEGTQRLVKTAAPDIAIRSVRLAVPGRSVTLSPAGGGPVTLASWAVGRNRPGVHYVSLGLPRARFTVLERLDDWLLASDLRRLRPDLVVLGFGTIEGFDDNLALESYARRVSAIVTRLANLAPEASFLIIGPPDGARLPAHALRSAATPCRALSTEERRSYAKRLAERDPRLARWHPPPGLGGVRSALEAVARNAGAWYWDWSAAMGGPCAIHAWVHAQPRLARADHVHLTTAGYRRSARQLFDALMAAYAASRNAALGARR